MHEMHTTSTDPSLHKYRTTCYVVCRATEQEAKDYHAYYVDQNADWVAADKLMTGLITHSKTFSSEAQSKLRSGMAAGHGSWPVIGTPRQVADKNIAAARGRLQWDYCVVCGLHKGVSVLSR